MADRIHLVVERAEKERFRRLAARQGKSLSEWLREAASEKADRLADRTLSDRASLEEFFRECGERERGREPDWASHRSVIERSKRSGAAES